MTNTNADVFISPHGRDDARGSLDGPFATLARARDAVRELKHAEPARDIRVLIRGGLYTLDETVVFSLEDGAEDAAAGGATITYAAYGDERPVFSSGVPVTGWRRLDDEPDALPEAARGKVWVADVPEGLDRFVTLFDGDTRLLRARSAGFMSDKIEYDATVSFNVTREEDRHLLRRVPFPKGAMRAWPNVEDAEVVFVPVPWCFNILPLEAVDEEASVAWTSIEATVPAFAKPTAEAWVENMIDFLDEPGEWVVNTQERKVYLWPKGDAPSDNIVAPRLKELIRVEGAIDFDGPVDAPVCGIVFEGLTFTHGERDTWDKDHKGYGLQHDWEKEDRGTALLRLRGAERCAIRGCRFTNSGGVGVRLDCHCQDNVVDSNLIDRVGSVGILLNGYGPGTKDVNKRNAVTNNIIHHCGEILLHAQAIIVAQSGENHIAHNVIHHCPRLGVSICGVRVPMLEERHIDYDDTSKTFRWGEMDAAIAPPGDGPDDNWDRFTPFLHARGNIVEYNEIYRVLEALNDGAAINLTGAGEDNIIRRNYIHHIAVHKGAGGLRVDDWQRGTTFEENIVHMTNLGGITRKNFNHVVNNVFVDCSARGYVRFASYPNEAAGYGSLVERNIYCESLPGVTYYAMAYMASDGVSYPKHCAADRNVFWCAENPAEAEASLDELRKDGIEPNSIAADPMFVDAANGDFRLKDDSPALTLGIVSLDRHEAGLRDDYPEWLRELDEPDDGSAPEYHRGRDKTKGEHTFW